LKKAVNKMSSKTPKTIKLQTRMMKKKSQPSNLLKTKMKKRLLTTFLSKKMRNKCPPKKSSKKLSINPSCPSLMRLTFGFRILVLRSISLC
jgi:hypothetical protein